MKKFSRIQYQEELNEKLSKTSDIEDSLEQNDIKNSFIIFEINDVKYKISFNQVSTINIIYNYTIMPMINKYIFGITNLNSTEVILVDVNSWNKNKLSNFFIEPLPKEYLCLTLKKEKIGICCKVYPSESNLNLEEYISFDVDMFLKSLK
jgi:chemotaxis signal transduction protein